MFPSLRGSFERLPVEPDAIREDGVSIPQRKFRKARRIERNLLRRRFPSLRGSFESNAATGRRRRKDGFPSLRGSFESPPQLSWYGQHTPFPSLRGSFERMAGPPRRARGTGVSIPQRKFRKAGSGSSSPCRRWSFHPSEEVSKAKRTDARSPSRILFPSLRGSFESVAKLVRSHIAGAFPSLRGSFESGIFRPGEVPLLGFPSLRGSFERGG